MVVFSFSINSFICFPSEAFINIDEILIPEGSPLVAFIVNKSSVQPVSPESLLYTTTAFAPAV